MYTRKLYDLDEELELTNIIHITKLCHEKVEKEKVRRKEKFGEKISRAKIVCNLILKHL